MKVKTTFIVVMIMKQIKLSKNIKKSRLRKKQNLHNKTLKESDHNTIRNISSAREQNVCHLLYNRTYLCNTNWICISEEKLAYLPKSAFTVRSDFWVNLPYRNGFGRTIL